ncbi:hypothetical protein ACFTAO_17470 [Paenibacillus rhizoplanae]
MTKSPKSTKKVASLYAIQRMLTGLLETPQEDIQNYLHSFQVPDKNH